MARIRIILLILGSCFFVACGPDGTTNPSDTTPTVTVDTGTNPTDSGADTGGAEDTGEETDPTDCRPGESQQQACGPDGRGTQQRDCTAEGSWGNWGECIGSNQCPESEKSTRSCPGGGEQTRTCVDGDWSEWSKCTSSWASISSNEEEFCLIDESGAVTCVDPGLNPTSYDGPYTQAVQVRQGFCGLRPDQTLHCEGSAGFGDQQKVIDEAPSGKFQKVDVEVYSSKYHLACGLRASGKIDCWGAQEYVKPFEKLTGNFVDLAVSGRVMCAVRASGELICRGTEQENDRSLTGSTFTNVTVGSDHVCGLKSDGSVECGLLRDPLDQPYHRDGNEFGQHAAPSGTFQTIDAGPEHNCGLRSDGSIECWGRNGDYESARNSGPFVDVAVLQGMTCGLGEDGKLDCWGHDNEMCKLRRVPLSSSSPNACGGCHALPIQPGNACACSGTFQCTPDRDASGTCDDGDNVIGSASAQPDTDDGVDEWTSINGTLAVYDDDWHSVHVDDGALGKFEPRIHLTSDRYNKLQVCFFYERDSGKEEGLDACSGGASFPWSGCQKVDRGNETIEGWCQELVVRQSSDGAAYESSLDVDIPDAGDDSGTAYFRVKSYGTEPGCIPYTLSYRF